MCGVPGSIYVFAHVAFLAYVRVAYVPEWRTWELWFLAVVVVAIVFSTLLRTS